MVLEIAVKVAIALTLLPATPDVGHKLPVREAAPIPPPSSSSVPPAPPVMSIGALGPCVGISAPEPVIRCAAAWKGIDFSEFLAVAQRESGLNPYAVSYTGCCKGLFQLHEDYFAAWAQRYTDLRWFGGIVPSYFDPRANALVAAGMWAAQGGPCPAWC
jgi:hypothetical protein